MSRLCRILSGGQTGVDQAALAAAQNVGLPTGGMMPRDYRTETGPRPDLAARYGLGESPSADPAARTRANIAAADATLLLIGGPADLHRNGSGLTHQAALEANQPVLVVDLDQEPDPRAAATFLAGYAVVNVAGNRESVCPGVYARALGFLTEAFRLALAEEPDRGRHR